MADGGGTTTNSTHAAKRIVHSSKLIRIMRMGVVIALNASLNSKGSGSTCQALIPQTQSFSEWEESGIQSQFAAKDDEYV